MNTIDPPSPQVGAGETRLVDVVDRLLDRGVVLRGEIWLSVADIDLVFIGADLVLASPDKMTAPPRPEGVEGAA